MGSLEQLLTRLRHGAWLAGPALKRQRLNDEVATRDVKKLREWANEWPVRGRAAGTLEKIMIEGLQASSFWRERAVFLYECLVHAIVLCGDKM